MSMFRTLQSNPGVITLYKTTLASRNLELLTFLKNHQRKQHQSIENSDNDNKNPSSSSSIWDKINSGLGGESSRDSGFNYELEVVDNETYPTYDQTKLIFSFDNNDKPEISQVLKQAFPKFEKSLRTETWQIPEEQQLRSLKDWFEAPLVVDWDKGLVASDIAGLKKIVDEYKS
ncbi:hypothetical protein WICPIJ_002996 [Wickerhamomyces pijperi]|uniref:Uncharacterized protein n=1 Tax=Wickerhamomyces pijperi TaxID=599730 RepID=A0A9P8Q7U9_WICPI|nr:hypothetical protein WICPIJ_002996 [Wickerhamomyces pijperi]